MYDIRSRWVPAYIKHIFSAGMSSSQRSESGHSFLKKYVNRNNSLMGFITRFNRALSHQRHEELVANHVDLNEQPRVTASVMMESQMVKIYTKKVFMKFQNEVVKSNLYICSKKETLSHMKTYVVQRLEHGSNFDRPRELQYYTDTDFVACSCRTFDFEGFPCRHMICFLKKKQVLLLPEKYILRRWTKNAKIGSACETNASNYRDDSSIQALIGRHGMLSQKAQVLVDDAALTDARSTFLLGEFEMLNLRVKEIDDGGIVGNIKSKSSSQSREVQQIIEDPTGVRAKGCGKRLKSSKEKAMSREIKGTHFSSHANSKSASKVPTSHHNPIQNQHQRYPLLITTQFKISIKGTHFSSHANSKSASKLKEYRSWDLEYAAGNSGESGGQRRRKWANAPVERRRRRRAKRDGESGRRRGPNATEKAAERRRRTPLLFAADNGDH
ncbi:Protein FAR1-RELATED SEQUENCE [Abeliophyllum distichum]|uniref:Protein FAR1-RELATED SEQUENCE n=1 Tax=Abeliophyllum distichum TaxID=126358 RepID=A0ABD1VYJ9_9LAMI